MKLSRKTVVRKMLFLAAEAELAIAQHHAKQPKALEVEFDDLETIEHTKLKPLSVSLMVEAKSRRILWLEVAQMPSKGKLAKLSRKKYGPRADHRPRARKALFERVKDLIAPQALLKFDMSPHYPKDVEKIFPECRIETFKGRRACIAGQGELKVGGFDPIFAINHTFAMLRANINRLFRRTWCTTKRPDRLRAHLMLYVHYHNTTLI